MNKIKLPILMYHEIANTIVKDTASYQMMPSYYVSLENFEEQIEYLAQRRYKAVDFNDIHDLDYNNKYVVFTFDDGWHGNHLYSLPILRKNNFKGIYFVTTSLIGTPGYMSWEEVIDLTNEGMSVQSHCATHRPLQGLDNNEIYQELHKSKQNIEMKTKKEVTALSFPHGSFNRKIIEAAVNAGYRTLCTSNISRTYNTTFRNKPVLLGRMNITQNISLEKFGKLTEYRAMDIYLETIIKGTKNSIKNIIGLNNYRKIYRYLFNIKKPIRID